MPSSTTSPRSSRAESAAASLLTLLPFMREQLMKPAEQTLRSRLAPQQFFALSLLAHHADPVMMSELADKMRVSKQQLTAIVDRLIEQRLVDRSRDAEDRRVVRVALTSSGHAMLGRVRRDARRALAGQLKTLPPRELAELETCLLRVREILAKTAPAGASPEGGAR